MDKIFIVGLPKCGTSSFDEYFRRVGYKTCHYTIGRDGLVGVLMKENYEANRPLLSGKLEDYQVFTQMDVCQPPHNVWPQITMLEELTLQYPDAKYILNTRNIEKHATSIIKWYNLQHRLTISDIKHLPIGIGSKREDIEHWITLHNQDVRTFFSKNSHLQFIELNIEEDIIEKLNDFIGITKTDIKFPHANKNMKIK